MGRPKYIPSEEHIQTAYDGASKGLNEKEIAKAIGIGITTFRKNKRIFANPIKTARDESYDKNIEKVENALLKRCLGYEYEEKHIEKRKSGETETIVQKSIRKAVQPSDTAIFFFLVNRSDKWKSINNREQNGNDINPVDLTEITAALKQLDANSVSVSDK